MPRDVLPLLGNENGAADVFSANDQASGFTRRVCALVGKQFEVPITLRLGCVLRPGDPQPRFTGDRALLILRGRPNAVRAWLVAER
jgi:hypothetical protein